MKKNIINDSGLTLLTWLTVNFFLPAFTFHQLTQHFNFQSYPDWWTFPLISFLITLGGFSLGWLVTKLSKGIGPKREFIALASFQNSGYLPLLLITAIFSPPEAQELYIYLFLFLIGFDFAVWSFGVWFLTRHKMEKFELKNLLSTPFIATSISLLLILCDLPKFIPPLLVKPIQMTGECTLPVAMIVVGASLARIKISDVNKKEITLVLLTKLVALPLAAMIFVLALKVPKLIGFFVVMEACVPSAVTLSIISRHYGTEEKFINQGIFFTHLFSMLTIPVFLMLYELMRIAL